MVHGVNCNKYKLMVLRIVPLRHKGHKVSLRRRFKEKALTSRLYREISALQYYSPSLWGGLGEVLLVYAETVNTIFQEANDLFRRSDTCVDVCFSGLSTHFLRSEEYTAFEFFQQFSFVVRSDV